VHPKSSHRHHHRHHSHSPSHSEEETDSSEDLEDTPKRSKQGSVSSSRPGGHQNYHGSGHRMPMGVYNPQHRY
jgi:hypothetical protein